MHNGDRDGFPERSGLVNCGHWMMPMLWSGGRADKISNKLAGDIACLGGSMVEHQPRLLGFRVRFPAGAFASFSVSAKASLPFPFPFSFPFLLSPPLPLPSSSFPFPSPFDLSFALKTHLRIYPINYSFSPCVMHNGDRDGFPERSGLVNCGHWMMPMLWSGGRADKISNKLAGDIACLVAQWHQPRLLGFRVRSRLGRLRFSFRFCQSFTSNSPFPFLLSLSPFPPLPFPSSSFPFPSLLRPFVCAKKMHLRIYHICLSFPLLEDPLCPFFFFFFFYKK